MTANRKRICLAVAVASIPPPAMEVPQAIADKENVVEVELPMMPFM
jgi:hypothetical protein